MSENIINQTIEMKENIANAPNTPQTIKQAEEVNRLLRRVGVRRLYDVYLKVLCKKSCELGIVEMTQGSFRILNTAANNPVYNTDPPSNSPLKRLNCESIFKNGTNHRDGLNIEVGTYFEIIKLVKSQHKVIASTGKITPDRLFNPSTHLIALFIKEIDGEMRWMTLGIDPNGLASPDFLFTMKCNNLLKQEYKYSNLHGRNLRTNRKRGSRVNQSLENMYPHQEKQMKLSVVASSTLNQGQYDRLMESFQETPEYKIYQFHPIAQKKCTSVNCASYLLYIFQDILGHQPGMPISAITVETKKPNRNRFKRAVRNGNVSQFKSLVANRMFERTNYPKINNRDYRIFAHNVRGYLNDMLRLLNNNKSMTLDRISKAMKNGKKNQINILSKELEHISNGVVKLTNFIRSRRMKKVIIQQIGQSLFFKHNRVDDEAIAFVLNLI